MPVEIRELQITAVVQNAPASAQSSSSHETPANNDEIVAACVEQVLEILKQKNER
jgi:hypothetical protein